VFHKNRIAAVLAMMAMAGFLLMFGVLAFLRVPPENKDFFNMGFIALIGFVSTAFGYYLGSSLGSAHKNELFGQTGTLLIPGHDAEDTRQAGFARLPAMALLVLAAGLMLFAGCATVQKDGPQVTAGKSLLAVKQTIVAAANTADVLCRSGQMSADKCTQAKAAYEISKPAYDSAVDAYLLMSEGGDPAAFGAAMTRLQGIAGNMALLAGGAN